MWGSINFTRIVCILLMINITQAHRATFHHTYECINNNCQRNDRPIDTIDYQLLKANNQHTTLASCRLICGKGAGLWPLPTGPLTTGKTYMEINPTQLYLNMDRTPVNVRPFVSEIFDIFVKNIRSTCRNNCAGNFSMNRNVTIYVLIESTNLNLDWDTKEEYKLDVTTKGDQFTVDITATTVFGARHALETLSQLTAPVRTWKKQWGLVMIDNADIVDIPVYSHRGLLIDTSRNFLNVQDILRTIDGLASVKMNVLHWHATDSQSFPLEIRNVPQMSMYGSYGHDKIYTTRDVDRILTYAKVHGVRVILELDSPSHAGAGWNWGPEAGLGNLAVCVNQDPWRDYCIQPPCGQLNPVNPNTLEVLRNIYKEVLENWQETGKVLHLGGDEVFLNCWNSTSEIVSEMAKRGMGRREEDFLRLWGEFHGQQLKILDDLRKNREETVILWSSHLTTPGIVEKYLNRDRFVIQTWVERDSELPEQLLNLGYRLIMSTKDAWYLDHGFWGNTKYHTWKHVYSNRIPKNEQILGGEACMWGEYVNSGNLDSRVWPRAAAIAERLWTNPVDTSSANRIESRLQSHIERLKARDIKSDAIRPEWCAQHEQRCL